MGDDISRLLARIFLAVVAVVGITAGGLGYTLGRRGLASRTPVAIDTIVRESIRLDTVYRADTVRLWRAKTVYDTARVTDTLLRGDTVFVPRDVADRAVDACMDAVGTCERRQALAAAEATFWKDSVARIPPQPDVRKVATVTAIIAALVTLLLAR